MYILGKFVSSFYNWDHTLPLNGRILYNTRRYFDNRILTNCMPISVKLTHINVTWRLQYCVQRLANEHWLVHARQQSHRNLLPVSRFNLATIRSETLQKRKRVRSTSSAVMIMLVSLRTKTLRKGRKKQKATAHTLQR